MEWLRSWFLSGFTWLSPADTLVNFGFAPLLPLTGTLGISYLFYSLIALLLYLLLNRTLKVFIVFILFVLSMILVLWGLENKTYTVPMKKKVYTQIIQSHFTKKDKSKRYKVIQHVKNAQQLALQEPLPELSVWSESSISVDYESIRRYLKNGFEKLRKANVEIFYGAYIQEQNVLMKNSSEAIAYSKQHLMPFGEYTPEWLIKIKSLLPTFENNNLQHGRKREPIKLNGVYYAPSICYELLFPNELRRLASKSNILVHISDLGWFDHSWAQRYLLNLARMRSLEHQKPMIYVVNFGNSAFISANGVIQMISKSKQGIEALYAYVQPYKGETPYAKYGDKPLLLWCVLMMIIYFMRERKDVLSRD